MAEQRQPGSEATAIPRARPAATVILVRPTPTGVEALMVRRLASASAFADVFVFPGGVVRADDAAPDPIDPGFADADALAALSARGGQPPADAGRARALWRAAIREVFEEAGVLLARDPLGAPARRSDTARWAAWRDDLQAGRVTLSEILRQEHLTPDYRRLIYFSHWITPDNAPRRFDTRFFVAEMPPGQTAIHCQVETTESIWIAPAEALARSAAGAFPLVFPTRKHLARLRGFRSVAEVLAFAATKPIRTVHPRREVVGGVERIELPGDGEDW